MTTQNPDQPKCELCGEPMPPGEEMFKLHGYSGPCPKAALPSRVPHSVGVYAKVGSDNRLHEDLTVGRERPFSALQEMLCCLAHMYFEVCSGITDRKPGDCFELVLTVKPMAARPDEQSITTDQKPAE